MQAVYKCTYDPGVLISDLKGPCPSYTSPSFPKNIHAEIRSVTFLEKGITLN